MEEGADGEGPSPRASDLLGALYLSEQGSLTARVLGPKSKSFSALRDAEHGHYTPYGSASQCGKAFQLARFGEKKRMNSKLAKELHEAHTVACKTDRFKKARTK